MWQLVISALSAGLAHADSAAAPQEVKNIVLVHGLYAAGDQHSADVEMTKKWQRHDVAAEDLKVIKAED
jgi:hypothetical protein